MSALESDAYYDGLDYDLSYDAAAFENYTRHHGWNGTHHQVIVYPTLGVWEYIRITWTTVFSGIYFSLIIFALRHIFRNHDLQVKPNFFFPSIINPIIASQNHFFLKLSVVFGLKLVIDTTEYFVYYDFYFFKNIDYANHGQAVSYYLEFARIVKRTMVFALGEEYQSTSVGH